VRLSADLDLCRSGVQRRAGDEGFEIKGGALIETRTEMGDQGEGQKAALGGADHRPAGTSAVD